MCHPENLGHVVVSRLGLFMAGNHEAGTKSLNSVNTSNPLFPLRGPSQPKHLVDFIVGHVTGNYGVERGDMEHGGRSDVALAYFNDTQFVPFKQDEFVVKWGGEGSWQHDVLAKQGKKGLFFIVVMRTDVIDDAWRCYNTCSGESSGKATATKIVVAMAMSDKDVRELLVGLFDHITERIDVILEELGVYQYSVPLAVNKGRCNWRKGAVGRSDPSRGAGKYLKLN